jgi:phosphate transport system substrate-binding protein
MNGVNQVNTTRSRPRRPTFEALRSLARKSMFVSAALSVPWAHAQEFNLGELPSYQPARKVSGVIRNWGNDTMVELMKYWEEGFKKHQPDIRFEDNMATTAIAIPALTVGVADIGVMGREVWPIELISYLKVHKGTPLTVAVAGGTFDVENKTWALTVFVHKDNPLSRLTLAQLDGIFGAERTGHWDETKSKWIVDASRGPEKNIRTWGQLGLTGEWANKPIQTYGFDLTGSGFSFFFAHRVFNGGDKWNDNLKEYVGISKPGGGFLSSPPQVTAALSKDRYGIGFSGMQYKTADLKPIAIAAEGSNYVMPTKKSVQDMTYPLSRSLFFLVKRAAGKPVDPKLKEFMTYILSREGQEAVAREGDYLPLPANVAREQLKKLE